MLYMCVGAEVIGNVYTVCSATVCRVFGLVRTVYGIVSLIIVYGCGMKKHTTYQTHLIYDLIAIIIQLSIHTINEIFLQHDTN